MQRSHVAVGWHTVGGSDRGLVARGQRTVKAALNFQAAADAKRYIVPKNMAIVINVTDIGL